MSHQHRATRTRGVVGVIVVLAVAGFLFSANARISAGSEREPADLRGVVQAELDRAELAATEVSELRADVDQLTDEQTPDEQADPAVSDQVALAAGWVAVTGPGLEVRLWDAPPGATRPEWATNDDVVVHQQDVQAVINALWAGGAEAMGLQDQRVVSTSAFRCVGNVLWLQGRLYSPPYVVRAIGDVDTMLAALDDSPSVQRYLEYVDAVGLGYSVTEVAGIDLPAYDGSAELRYASVAPDTGDAQ
ncbi:DUF881 domain-containing protein [Actinotalea sp. M2MS4P-6]|uniref:DUF881 domain-containing protein n=1 Tax=Actinotalea sp. M2MS4P-6 TaxID=2983762 RepID=UPI0021E3DB2C|nr:DUF881 domain-containing protein [Actinotalea sp. M2MS4P-6]MCV2392828.1 DUF881 domain-containing protein [Actinotalea sp. M2MS4P-6]